MRLRITGKKTFLVRSGLLPQTGANPEAESRSTAAKLQVFWPDGQRLAIYHGEKAVANTTLAASQERMRKGVCAKDLLLFALVSSGTEHIIINKEVSSSFAT